MSIYKPGRPAKYILATGAGIKPPSQSGEYRIRDTAGTIQYVGETCNLNQRMHEHVRTGKLAEGWSIECKVANGRSTSATRRRHEQAKIEQHQPPLNKSKGGEGRPAGRCPCGPAFEQAM